VEKLSIFIIVGLLSKVGYGCRSEGGQNGKPSWMLLMRHYGKQMLGSKAEVENGKTGCEVRWKMGLAQEHVCLFLF